MAQKQAPHPRRKGSVVWATVLSWLSSLLLALLALCLVLMTTICSASYMKEQVNRSDFSEAAYSYLYDNFISYGASSGFSADVMTAALSRDQITADMADSITRLYQGDTAIDTRNAILNTTYDNLINDLNSRGVEVTSDVESAVVVVADACRLDYANYVTVPLASQLYTFIEKCSRVVPVAVAIMAVLCAVSLFVMLRLAGSSRYLRIPRNHTGLTNVITSKDEGALAAALVRVKDSGITVLTAGTIPPNPTELLSTPMTEKIFASLQKAFDYVIIDTPPVSVVTDAAVLCGIADGVLLVVRPGVTTIQSAQLSKKNLEAVNAHILGVVMNGYNGTQSGRRDGYSYAYSYSYYDEDKKGNDA